MKAVLLDAGKQIMPRADVFAPGKFFYDSDYSRKPYRKQNQQGNVDQIDHVIETENRLESKIFLELSAYVFLEKIRRDQQPLVSGYEEGSRKEEKQETQE